MAMNEPKFEAIYSTCSVGSVTKFNITASLFEALAVGDVTREGAVFWSLNKHAMAVLPSFVHRASVMLCLRPLA